MHKPRIAPTRVLFPIGLGTALSLMGDATLYTVLPTHTDAVGITLTQVGIMLGINRAIRLLSNGPAGFAYDRFPRRWIFIPALFLGTLSTLIYAFSHNFWPLLVGRLLWGISWSGIWIGGTNMILDVTNETDRGRWTGLYQVWFFFGTASGAMVGGGLTDYLGFHKAMWIGAIITSLGALATLFLLPETRPELRDRGLQIFRDARSLIISRFQHLFKSKRQTILFNDKIDKTRFIFVVCLRGVNRFIISGILSATLGLIVRDRLVFADMLLGVASLTGILMAGRTLMSMLGAILSGLVSDYIRNRWVVLAGALVLSMGSMLFLSSRHNIFIVLGVLFAALGRGSVQSMTTSMTGDLVPQVTRGRAVGLLHTVGDFGSAVGPSFAYALIPYWGISTLFILCAVIYGCCLLINVVIDRAEPKAT
jgi:MFS family permease